MQTFDENSSSRDVLAELLTRYVGHSRAISSEAFARAAGCSVENVSVARNGGVVSADTTARMVRALPDEAAVEYIRRCLGFTFAVRIDSAGGCHHEVGRELSLGTAEYVQAVSDGHIDHREDRALVQRYYRIMAVLGRATAAARCVRPRA